MYLIFFNDMDLMLLTELFVQLGHDWIKYRHVAFELFKDMRLGGPFPGNNRLTHIEQIGELESKQELILGVFGMLHRSNTVANDFFAAKGRKVLFV